MKTDRRRSFYLAFALAVILSPIPPASAGPAGSLDPSFGGDGVVTLQISGVKYAYWNSMALLPDGRIVAGGSAQHDAYPNFIEGVVAVYHPNGILDAGFDGDGILVLNDFNEYGGVSRLGLQDLDGQLKLILAGTVHGNGPDGMKDSSDDTYAGTVARYNLDGSIDTTFGQGGKVILHQSFPQLFSSKFGKSFIDNIQISPDGKILLLTQSLQGGTVILFNPDGSPDTSFGNVGSVTPNVPNETLTLRDAVILGDGKIIVAGDTYSHKPALYRINTDGTLDPTFQNGPRTDPVFQQFWNPGFHVTDIALQSDGNEKKIIIVGTDYCGVNNVEKDCAAAARFNADGSLDSSFAANGLSLSQEMRTAEAIVVQGDGKFIVTTYGANEPAKCGGQHCAVLYRLQTNGAPDPGFGTGGEVIIPRYSGKGVESGGSSLALDALGRILVAGMSFLQKQKFDIHIFAIARHLGDQPSPCGNGTVDPGEACDDGNAVNGDGCDANCTPTGCGNSVLTAGEACDDGNTLNGDGCDKSCQIEPPPSPPPPPSDCGNGKVEPGEQCEPPNSKINFLTYCTSECKKKIIIFSEFPICGNGKVQEGEQCDDGNKVNGDGCNDKCQKELQTPKFYRELQKSPPPPAPAVKSFNRPQ